MRLPLRLSFGGNKSPSVKFSLSQIASAVHPAKHFRSVRPSSPSVIDSDGFLSSCAGQRAFQPSPLRVTPCNRDKIEVVFIRLVCRRVSFGRERGGFFSGSCCLDLRFQTVKVIEKRLTIEERDPASRALFSQ